MLSALRQQSIALTNVDWVPGITYGWHHKETMSHMLPTCILELVIKYRMFHILYWSCQFYIDLTSNLDDGYWTLSCKMTELNKYIFESSPIHLGIRHEGASFRKQSTVTEREKPIAHEHTRIGPNRPQPINQSEMVYTNQSEQVIRDQSDHSICALTNYYWSVTNAYDWSILTNQKITLIIFWLAKNGKDKIRTPHWSKK